MKIWCVKNIPDFFAVPENTDVYVIHSASIVTLNPNPSEKVYAVNVVGTQNIINKYVSHKVKKLVYISSTGAIPERQGNIPIKEVSHFRSQGLVGYYSVTKAEASQLVLNALEMVPELDASIVNPSGICGPDDYSFGPLAESRRKNIMKLAKAKVTTAIAVLMAILGLAAISILRIETLF